MLVHVNVLQLSATKEGWTHAACCCCVVVQEAGFNGLHLNQVVHGWVRGVTVRNSDMGVYTWGSVFVTISGLTLSNSKQRAWYNGHRGVWMEHGSDSMLSK
jgi:hypothetical protein